MEDIETLKDIFRTTYLIPYCKICDLVNLRAFISSDCDNCNMKSSEFVKSATLEWGGDLYE